VSVAIDYYLAIATDASPVAIAAIALPDLAVHEAADLPGVFTTDTRASHGFGVVLRTARNQWVSGVSDDGGEWEWAPDVYASVSFRMAKNDDSGKGMPNMLAAIARVMAALKDDLAFTSDNFVYLTRFAGQVVKYHRKDFWDWYEFANTIVPR
jgi:hypothetical protein